MVATLAIISGHGAANITGGDAGTGATTFATTETDITSATIKYKWADNDTNDLLTPIVRSASSTVYSFRKSMRLKATAAPDGQLTNLRWFSDTGAWRTGVTLFAHTLATANYTVAGAGDETAQIAQNGGSAVTDASTFTSGFPLVINSGVIIGATTGYTDAGHTQAIVETQLQATTSVVRGNASTASRVYTYRVDES